MPLRIRSVLCELGFGLRRGTLLAQRREKGVCRERNGGCSSEGRRRGERRCGGVEEAAVKIINHN